MNKIKIMLIQLLIALLIAFATYKIAGENYNSISWFGGCICLGIILAIIEILEERNVR